VIAAETTAAGRPRSACSACRRRPGAVEADAPAEDAHDLPPPRRPSPGSLAGGGAARFDAPRSSGGEHRLRCT
jgi:hypothetical protein